MKRWPTNLLLVRGRVTLREAEMEKERNIEAGLARAREMKRDGAREDCCCRPVCLIPGTFVSET